MNANELADYLDNNVEAMLMSEQIHIDQAATMLRQQQAEIESLKEGIEKLKDAYCQRDSQVRQQQAEIEALKSVVYWLKENRPEVWNDIKKWSKQ